MPHTLTWQDGGGIIKYTGQVSAKEMCEITMTLAGNHQFDDVRWGLNDFTNCANISYDLTSMEEIASNIRSASMSNSRIRVAFVPDRPDVVEMIEAFKATKILSYDHRVFPSAEEAMKWLRSGWDSKTHSVR